MDTNQPSSPSPQSPQKSPRGYGKRPLWFWIVVYLIIGAIVYGLIYYFFFMRSGTGYGY